jgi:hypothetical protein
MALPAAARADEPTADKISVAAKEYDDGRRLYLESKYDEAAAHFEAAFVAAPRAEPLRNAIRARRSARQYARAATLAQLALSEYPNDTQTAQLAWDAVNDLGPKVHAVVVTCDAKCAVAADGKPLTMIDATKHRLFVEPGGHELTVTVGARTRQVKIDAKVGEKTELSVQPPMESPSPPPAAVTGARLTSGGKPFGPAVPAVLAGLTLVAGGATIFSGLDAQSNPGSDAVKRDCVGQGESCPTYQKGVDAQNRTNILLGVTAGLAVATGVVAIFFTQWSSPPKKSVGRHRPGTPSGTSLRMYPDVSPAILGSRTNAWGLVGSF